MSDEVMKFHRYSVTTDDFIRFLEAKTDDSTCPACHSAAWTVIGSSQNDMAYRLVTPLRDGPGPNQINCFGIHCNECGFIRQHLAKVVKRWVNDNPAPEQLELDEIDTDDFE